MAKKIKTSASNPNIVDDPLAKIQAQQAVLPENFSVGVLPSLKKVQDTLISKSLPVKTSKVKISADFEDELRLKKEEKLGLMNATPLMKSVVSLLDQEGFSRDSTATIERLAFEINPHFYSQYSSVFIPKEHLVPDFVLKRIAVQDELVASIVRVRATQIGSFGRHQIDRFATGFRIQPMPGILEKADEKQKKEIQDRITTAVKKLLTCGETKGLSYKERTTLAQFLYIQARNAVVLGRFATEILWVDNPKTNKRIFHSFRPIDVGTLYKAVPQKSQVDTVRLEARNMLEALKNKRLEPEKFVNDEYAWVQVIDAQPVQAFGPEECVVFDCYPTADIEFGGYPVTPIDTCIASITTHMNIVSHNKIYFQSGRASRGILVIRSEDVDIPTINMIRQQFNNSINSVTNCIAGDTQIITETGAFSIENLLNGAETKMTRVWTGTEWCDAMVYRVDEKKELCTLKLQNGAEIKTSPNHRFYVIGDNGEPIWKEQKDIVVGDFAAINKIPASNNDLIPNFNGKPSNKLPVQTLNKYLRIVKEKARTDNVLTSRQHMDIDAILRGEDSCSANRLFNYMNMVGLTAPTWMKDYNFEPVISVTNTHEYVQMYDATVYDKNHGCTGIKCQSDKHSLITSGFYTHQSWRMPVFAMSEKDKVEWVPIDMAHRDQEFAFLSDNNARTIFSAFQMSPEEVPGYGHLARGTLSQGMSESSNEWKLEAARDVGIRPLLAQFQDFLNKVIFPLIDKELAEICVLTLSGLDADTQERENEQLTNQASLHMTYNEVLQKVEKNVMPHELGGDFPFNAQYQQILDRYFTVGEIKEAFFGCEGASKDPTLAYYRDEYWMNWQTTMLQKQQMDQQSQMAQEQAQGQQSVDAQQMQQEAQNLDPNIQDIGSGVDQLLSFLGKNQSVNLTPNKKKLLAQHRLTVKNVMQNFEKDSKGLLANLTKVALENKKKK